FLKSPARIAFSIADSGSEERPADAEVATSQSPLAGVPAETVWARTLQNRKTRTRPTSAQRIIQVLVGNSGKRVRGRRWESIRQGAARLEKSWLQIGHCTRLLRDGLFVDCRLPQPTQLVHRPVTKHSLAEDIAFLHRAEIAAVIRHASVVTEHEVAVKRHDYFR